jgi:hypothetical protein
VPAQAGILASLFTPLITRGADAGANYLIDNQAKIVGELRAIEGDAVTFIENELLAAIPRQSLEQKAVAGEFAATIKNLAGEIAAQLPAADEALVNALESVLEKLSASVAGT